MTGIYLLSDSPGVFLMLVFNRTKPLLKYVENSYHSSDVTLMQILIMSWAQTEAPQSFTDKIIAESET